MYVILMSESSGSISVPAAVNISEHPCMRRTSVLAFGNDTTNIC